MENDVLITDYGMGNIRSVANALTHLGARVRVSGQPGDIQKAQRIVLPGVGAFGEAMERLRAAGLIEVLRSEVLDQNRPFLGICLGMQLLASRSFEHGEHDGLGWIPGEVRALTPTSDCRVPHVGWNDVEVRSPCALVPEPERAAYYFVHSYEFVPSDPSTVVAITNHGHDMTSIVAHGKIFGTQFHPEKSHAPGLRLLRRFLELV